ncbi:ATP-binding region ATPase domain protein [Emticicia oligotrophica DSM 17448]|uniref:ATP-binding region ATPase domain protein n=1 Tax=Emticicia oligotrophica (strain DSM 17448 / CIP 109782 / MTCC 6937 / GPTSA100-15) TaxID=929562 RepID=A0ABM5N444_EMTOG|nr:molecular chaperone HtpG [Emticicia oligotrophica]AFK04169.1 ATP-binding region ATPase domain protein [Emticicia oligotrophica DSM 17448]
MVAEKGTISINTENIFPIIKKFLYSDHEIFLRELVSNAVDATQKLKKLSSMGEFNGELGDLTIKVSVDKEAKTITISDKGIGMSAEDIKKYINQIAFSGAKEFLEKYKDTPDTNQIIGQFGLGFYSAFMVAENVEIITKSYRDDAPARWICDGSTEFEITDAEKAERGTDIILHVGVDSEEFLDNFRISGILEKYAKFLPVEIEFDGKVINNPNPIWVKSPSDLTDEDYKSFYKELYPFGEDPLFWIHLNVDYPFNLTGVLYFPKIKKDFQLNRDKVQLYSRQVFITDDVKDVVPEFLQLLHGVIDSPDIPLNVSRSYLQADGNVKKINSHITKKVADKLQEIFRNDRAGFEEKWDSVGLFVKYGIVSDDKFYDRSKEFILLKNVDGKHFTLDEYREKVQALQTNKDESVVFLYANDVNQQDAFIATAKKREYDVLVMDSPLDSHFINALEAKLEKVTFKRVDSDSIDKLIDKGLNLESVLSEDEKKKVEELFKAVVGTNTVQLESLPADDMPVTIVQPEFMRRWRDMQRISGQGDMFGMMPMNNNVVINTNHSLVAKLLKTEDSTAQNALTKQLYDLALLAQGMLTGADLTKFVERTVAGL